MEPYVYWFLLALGMLVAEMATGTFYMLVLSVAFGAGGAAALLGFGEPLQFVCGAAVGVAGIVALRRAKAGRPADASGQNLDVGQPVQIVAWHEDGTARAHYRGAEWDAELETVDAPRGGALYIKSMRGSTLILTHNKP